MLEVNLYDALKGSTLVTAYTSNRIYPIEIPQKPTYPVLSYFRVSSNPQNTLGGYSGLGNPSFQIDVWSTSYLTSKTISRNIVTVLDNTTELESIFIADHDFFEPESNTEKKLYRVAMDFSIWGLE